MNFFDFLLKNHDLSAFVKSYKDNEFPISLIGPSDLYKAIILSLLIKQSGKDIICILPDESSCVNFVNDLKNLNTPAYYYPSRDISFDENQTVSREYEHMRLAALNSVFEKQNSVIVTTAYAISQRTIPQTVLQNSRLKLSVGDKIDISTLKEKLIFSGYSVSDEVEGIGTFSNRGEIFDLFVPGQKLPFRIDFFDDEIENIYVFDLDSQRRLGQVKNIEIIPAKEYIFDDEKTNEIENPDKYIPSFHPMTTLLDYFETAPIFLCDGYNSYKNTKAEEKIFFEDLKFALKAKFITKKNSEFIKHTDALFNEIYSKQIIFADTFLRGDFPLEIKRKYNTTSVFQGNWQGSIKQLKEEIEDKDYTYILYAGTEKAAKNVFRTLNDENIEAYIKSDLSEQLNQNKINILSGNLSESIAFAESKLKIISSNIRTTSKPKTHKKKNKNSFNSLSDLQNGDYVVHANYGIGRFEGIKTLTVTGITKDYIKILYDKGDELFIPVNQLDLLSKYVGSHDGIIKPKLNKLGTKQWQKTKQKIKAQTDDIAKDLIALYAKRMKIKGYQYLPDTDLQNDFESRFEYDETEDQLKAVSDIKKDMEKPYPMDRLLCGDVGFGKTEVALRAAFKAIVEGKQVAFVVPTTILAFQHYLTVTNRFADFPVGIDMISRFRTAKEQNTILKDLSAGNIDLIVGTHRLLSKDIKFHNLGLLIIDEEQRFGVAQKEKLKEKYPSVDVLTLSATPIPRTLNMAVSGLRDLSVIKQAPADRQPIQTYVLEYDKRIIAAAIEKELRRHGQVYYLHNDIETIESKAREIAEMTGGKAQVDIAHGRMNEEQLTKVWKKLLNHKTDILVCTTIIETGVDVPNVNTLIIENADRMGLAALHQIRGRIGRSMLKAYAYFTFKRGKQLSEIAEKRLRSIREYTAFGSGFKIAMRDLELRGAGNLLGKAQSGQLNAVGYEMYIKLLSNSIKKQKGEKTDFAYDDKDCLINIQINAHIPKKYIENLNQRLYVYRRIADLYTNEDAQDLISELEDRFSNPPTSVITLIKTALLRRKAADIGIVEISQQENELFIYKNTFEMEEITALNDFFKGGVIVGKGKRPKVIIKLLDNRPMIVAEKVVSVLQKLKED
ncbi:MAG: transcription-repair coupling factor [Clostridia bacterium]|nr:transcription-repair coupling factor [Clostridia bacterium]